ncbi:hypothetical protein PPTG_23768 [Phytophthora nicotianae INRA-310]|uniref:Uncharacterized protein n=1 Tax=Phytophthora nicotianae (strain INRA-310) TaxID=761204 RepID=W2PRU4_PHYN3|nr:hypothetical protein PPTG_23768 [Phytophthora nicotianae INRA-310]ETN03652.1 hypothetical protein PPTG_23768 [Phytophthora nicotianae INRA-310]
MVKRVPDDNLAMSFHVLYARRCTQAGLRIDHLQILPLATLVFSSRRSLLYLCPRLDYASPGL